MKTNRFHKMLRFSILAMAWVAASAPVWAGSAPAPEKKGLPKEEAIALAEAFVSEQGYTEAAAPSRDSVIFEPLDSSKDPAQVLKQRRGSLNPKAAGARLDSELWFVGFKTMAGDRIRGVLVDPQNRKAKMVSQNLRLEWLNEPPQKSTETAKTPAQAPAKTQPAAPPEKAGKKGKKR